MPVGGSYGYGVTYGDTSENIDDTDWARLISTLAVAGVQAYGIYSGQESRTTIQSGPGGTTATSSTGAPVLSSENMGLIIMVGVIIVVLLVIRK